MSQHCIFFSVHFDEANNEVNGIQKKNYCDNKNHPKMLHAFLVACDDIFNSFHNNNVVSCCVFSSN